MQNKHITMIKDGLIKKEIDSHEVDVETYNRLPQNYKSKRFSGYKLWLQFIILHLL